MDMQSEKIYDVAIIGGGITGTSLLYTLSKYTNLEKLVLIEKYPDVAQVNSHFNANSQTLHFGDIETNYSLEKARDVKHGASLMAAYAELYAKDAMHISHKMVIAVGKQEVAELEKRFAEFKDLFPNLKKLTRDEIQKIEPHVMKGRKLDEEILALMSEKGYALNYQKISKSFIHEALKEHKDVDVHMNEAVTNISKNLGGWKIETNKGFIRAKIVITASGPHSLMFAKSLGYGNDLGILPVAGSFYRAQNLLNGKVYTMQIKKLPFAAVHGDPDVNDSTITRFGPTAKPLPMLERNHYETISDFFRTSVYTFDGIVSLLKIISDKTIFFYVLRNLMFDIPYVGKRMFLKEAQKVVPSLKLEDLHYEGSLGGIRPQVVDTKMKTLNLGEAKIIGDSIIFDITPSPGASVALDNARKNAIEIQKFLKDYHFDEQKFLKDHEFNY